MSMSIKRSGTRHAMPYLVRSADEREARDACELITIKDAALILGLAPSTVHNCKGGTGVFTRVRLGRSVRLIRAEVEQYKQERIAEAQRISRRRS